MQDKKACEGVDVPDDYYDPELIGELETKADIRGVGVDGDATKDEQVAYYTKLAQEHGEDSVSYCIQCVTSANETGCGLNKAAKLVDAEDAEVDVGGTKIAYQLSAMIVEDATADMAVKLFSATGAIALATGLQMLY